MEKENTILDLQDTLNLAIEMLHDDIINLSFIQQEYFESEKPTDFLKLQYTEIRNKLETLSKSMLYSYDVLKEAKAETTKEQMFLY